MTDCTDHHPPAANENVDPYLRADTALEELYRLRRELLQQDVAGMSLERYRLRQAVLERFTKTEAMLLAML
jgi:hypothetical protein